MTSMLTHPVQFVLSVACISTVAVFGLILILDLGGQLWQWLFPLNKWPDPTPWPTPSDWSEDAQYLATQAEEGNPVARAVVLDAEKDLGIRPVEYELWHQRVDRIRKARAK